MCECFGASKAAAICAVAMLKDSELSSFSLNLWEVSSHSQKCE